MEAAVVRGPHVSALQPDDMDQLAMEVKAKEEKGQCKVILWDNIKDNPPPEMKFYPLTMIPHKSHLVRAILDLSFAIHLSSEEIRQSVNNTTEKTAPQGVIDQLGHSPRRIMHVFAKVDYNAKIFMAKWGINDGFWRLDCQEGQEWICCCVLPQPAEKPINKSSQPPYKWDELSHHHSLVQRLKREEMSQPNILRPRSGHCQRISSQGITLPANITRSCH